MNLSDSELLTFIQTNGMLDLATIQKQAMECKKKQIIIGKHKQKIWQGTNGYYYTYLGEGSERKLARKKVLSELQDVIVEFYEGASHPKFKSVYRDWIKMKRDYGEIQQQTIDRYDAEYKRFIAGTELEEKRTDDITELWLEDFIKRTIHEQDLTAKRWGNLRIIINGTMKYARKHGYSELHMRTFLDELDISKKAFKRVPRRDCEQVFTKAEEENIKAFIRGKPTCMTSLGILFTFETGLRIGELSSLMPKDVNGNMLEVCRTEIRYKLNGHNVKEVRECTKGRDGYRKIVLTKEAQHILKKARMLNPFGEYIFQEKGKRIPGNNYTMKLTRICKQLGIRPRSMHKIRKTYATSLLNAGVDEKIVEKQMGHTNIATTREYYYYDNHTMEDAIEQIEGALHST